MVAAMFSGVCGSLAGKPPFLSDEPITRPAANPAAREEHRLHGAPVVAAGQLVELRQAEDLRRPPELAGHHDQA